MILSEKKKCRQWKIILSHSFVTLFLTEILAFILNPEGLIHSNRNIVNVAACMATTPTKNHEAVSNGSGREKKMKHIKMHTICIVIVLFILGHL